MPVLSINDQWASAQVGHHADYSVKNVQTYTNETSDLFIVQVEMKNLESRFVNHSKLSAFIKDSQNTLYPATVAETSSKIIPQGKGLVTISALMPKGSPKTGMQLLIGQSVKGNQLATLDETPDAYFHVTGFELPDREQEPQDTLKKIDMFPYTLSLSNFSTSVNMITEELTLSFHTELGKDLLTQTSTAGHRLIIEITDEQSDVTTSESIDLEAAASDISETGGKFIKLGKGKYEMENHDSDFIEHVNYSGKFRLKLYDEYLGHKRLITSKPVSWFASLE
ncbi:hypothetical protein [Paenibacillus hexagrammi]|uniref:DUF5643 domain-containing protein n=1 Tax=Paenibacillus hexagrammi TaxID=2908839 RepID=A0ABY3SKK0_9BACL|nr:hypothetical protein [Paenibacillus sp. YPD9-1]UJF34234.1 hypothetical protein L0M14_03100 [Paenibacillus sp. YPD9-1]